MKNIASKPLRAAATVLAIAVAVAMIFAMLSFSPAVYRFIYSTQTAVSGSSDIVISTNSSSDRIMDVTGPLNNLKEELDNEKSDVGESDKKESDKFKGVKIEYICPSLALYGLLDGEYVQLRGFEEGSFQLLQNIDIKNGSADGLDGNTDNIVISEDMADNFGLSVGDSITLSLGKQEPVRFYICGIAKKSGYFLNDSPYLCVGRIEGISRLLAGIEAKVCNEIYIGVNDGADIDALIDKISAMPEYSDMLVSGTGGAYIREQADSLSAPVVLAGVAVFALAVAVIVLLFMMSEGEKISLISKYTVIGATKKQIAGIFMLESVMLAMLGALVGSALAVGVFVGILKLTLSPTIIFSISAWRLFLSAVIGLVSAVASSSLPIFRAFKGTVRQNQTSIRQGGSSILKVLCPVMILLTVVCVIIEFTVSAATAVVSVISLVLALSTLGVCIASVLKAGAKAVGKLPNPSAKIAAVNIKRDGRFSKSVTVLGVGMTVSMMLFMAWSVTQSVFGDYVADFADLAFVTNVRATVDADAFKQVDGVADATKIVWKQGSLKGDGFDKTMNVLGSENALDIVNFKYITPEDEIRKLLSSEKPYLAADGNTYEYVFLDKALSVLYGVKVGDTMTMTLDGKSADVIVGGLLEHRLFSGNYIVMSDRRIEAGFGVTTDTVIVKAEGNINDVVNALRAEYANNNYYVVDVLTAYKWEMQSTNAVFDLVGTLAIVVAVFIFIVTVFAAQVGRSTAEKGRRALLNAGMSKRGLLGAEITEYSVVAAVSYILSFAVSVLLTACLIHALRLFGLYFEFMYEAWVVATVGAVMGIGYALVPVAFNYKKGYNIKRVDKE